MEIWRRMSVFQNIAKRVLLTGAVWLTPLSGWACGFNWYPPGGYFECCDDSGYVLLTEKLADLSIPGETETVPLWMWFSSKTAVPSPYAGLWRIGILDMSLVQAGEDQFRMSDPGGSETLLKWDRKKQVLEGSGWKGERVGSRIRLWANCGWSVEFNRGRVARIITPHKKALVFNYGAEGTVSSVTCDGKPLIAVGGVKEGTLEITVNGRKLGIVKTGMPVVRRVGKADVIRGSEQGVHRITGQGDAGSGRSYTYPVDEKMRPMITSMGRHEADTFTLAWHPQTRKIARWNEWEYTKIRDRKNRWDTIELVRKNAKGEVESYYRDINGGVRITQHGNVKHSEYRFTSGPAAGNIRKITHEVDGKVTYFQKNAYDEKGRLIRGQDNDDRLRFKYDDEARTAAAWKNDKLLWRKTMDEKGRIVKVEYPDGKELRLAYPEKRPATAELVWNNTSIVVQRNSDGSVKEGTAVIREISK